MFWIVVIAFRPECTFIVIVVVDSVPDLLWTHFFLTFNPWFWEQRQGLFKILTVNFQTQLLVQEWKHVSIFPDEIVWLPGLTRELLDRTVCWSHRSWACYCDHKEEVCQWDSPEEKDDEMVTNGTAWISN